MARPYLNEFNQSALEIVGHLISIAVNPGEGLIPRLSPIDWQLLAIFVSENLSLDRFHNSQIDE